MYLIIIILGAIILVQFRSILISSYKIGYYEQKLISRKVDISSVKNSGLISIIKG